MKSSDTFDQKESQEPTLKQKTAKGLLWGGIGSFLQQAIGLVFGVLIMRILTPNDYGLIAMLSIFTAIANSIMDSGFTTALINRNIIRNEDYNAVFWFNALAGIALYIILFFCAPLIAEFYDKPVLTNLSRLLFLSFIFSSLGIAHNAFLLKNIMAKQRSIVDSVAVLVSSGISLILALNGYIYWGLAIQVVSQSIISTLLRWFFSPWRPTLNFDFSPLREMFSFSIKMFFTNIILQVTANILSVVLGRYYGEKETGYYAQGNKWALLGTSVITNMINGVAQPVLVNAVNDKERQKNMFRKMTRFGAFVSFPCLLGFAFVGEEFIMIMVGNKWLDSLFYLQLFCIWGSISFLWYLYTNLLLVHNKSNIYMWGMLVLSVFQIVMALSLFSFGVKIMAIAYICCYFMGLFLWHYFANRIIGLRFWHVIKDLFPYFALTMSCISLCWFFTKGITDIYLRFFLKIVITIVLYSVVMWYSNSVIVKECYNYIRQKTSDS